MAASLISSSPSLSVTLTHATPRVKCTFNVQLNSFSSMGGLRLVPQIRISNAQKSSSPLTHTLKTRISCSVAQPETLLIVQNTIAKQLSIDETTVAPETKFVDLGADSLDTVEIMMALEEKFNVSIGESGAENIATVQDAADLIEKVKAASS